MRLIEDARQHEASYYAASCRYRHRYPQLSQNVQADVCILGGGLAGLHTALALAEQGRVPLVLEANRLGSGSSGRNGGQVIVGYACDPAVLVRQLGQDDASQAWNMSCDAVEQIAARICRYGIDCGWQRGQATVATSERRMEALLAHQTELANCFAWTANTLWDQAQLCSQLGSQHYVGALYDEVSGQLHPLNYCLGLAGAAQQSGALIFEQSPALRIERYGRAWKVYGDEFCVEACSLVVACNVFSSSLKGAQIERIGRKILPVVTYMLATEPLGALAANVIRNNMAVCDNNMLLDYFRLSEDGRLLFGGMVVYSMEKRQQHLEALHRRMLTVFPQLGDSKIDYGWCGYVDMTVNRAPHFGELASNLYFLQGFSGHGLALTGLGGEIVAEAIMGSPARLQLFSRLRHLSFPDIPLLQRALFGVGLHFYGLRDRFGY